MKKLLFTVGFIAFIGLAAGIAYENGSTPKCPEGQMCIMNKAAPTSSSASGTAAVGPNGTEYSSNFETVSSGCATGNMSDRVYNESFSTLESSPPQYRVNFEGVIITSNPCHTIDHEITKEGDNTFVMNVTTESSDGLCTQCVGMIEYEASFTNHGETYDLEIRHDGKEVRTLGFPESENSEDSDESEVEQRNVFTGVFNWLKSIF